jgi:Spy/CpxP family protein refolding chaperone
MVDLNRATLEALAEALPDDVAVELRDAYGRQAFPGIYDDPRGAGRYLRAALALPELDERQRARLEAIAEEYRPAHREVADQLAQIYADQEDASAGGFDRSQWRRRGEQRNRIEVLEFDRTEINAKALRQLRETLTERQQMQVRLPAEVA